MNFEQLYSKLPVYLQSVAISLYGRYLHSKRYDNEFYEAFSDMLSTNLYSKYDIETLYEIKFINLIESIKLNENSLKRFNFLYGDIKKYTKFEDIFNLNILTKNQLRECIEIFPVSNEKNYIKSHTSGTTGAGLIFPTSKIADSYQWAVWWRYRKSLGIKFDEKCAYFGGRNIVPHNDHKNIYRFSKYTNQFMFSAYHLNINTLDKYLRCIIDNNLKWVHGYPSTISDLCSLILEKYGDDHELPIEIVTLGAESLDSHQKSLIEKALKITPYEHYGLAEGVANFSMDTSKNYYVDEDFSYVEFIEDDNNSYKVVGTNLYNYHLPIIRYDTNDFADVEINEFPRKIKHIDGRIEDFIHLIDGTRVGRLDHFFKDQIHVKKAQIVQKNVGNIEIRIQPNKDFSDKDINNIKNLFHERFKDNLSFSVTIVDEIAKHSSGKHRFVVNDLKI